MLLALKNIDIDLLNKVATEFTNVIRTLVSEKVDLGHFEALQQKLNQAIPRMFKKLNQNHCCY